MRTRSTRATFDDSQRPGKARCNDSVVGRIFVLVTKCGMLTMVDRAWFWRLPHVPSQAMLRDWPVNLMRWRNPLNCPTVDHTVPTLSTVYSIRICCEPVRPEPSSIWEPLRSWSNISNCYKHISMLGQQLAPLFRINAWLQWISHRLYLVVECLVTLWHTWKLSLASRHETRW